MTEIMASLDDVNTHLPEDKLFVTDDNSDKLQIDAARFVRSMLSGFIPIATLATWDEPDNTPETIRMVAGKLIAARYYAIRYAEDSDTSNYAQNLYNEAVADINMIRTGQLTIIDADGAELEVGGSSLSADDFWPNDSTDPPKFTMDAIFS